MSLVHASCVELEGIGLLLRGASGAGKSDLALRLIDAGAALVADDQVLLEARGGRLLARAPGALAGLVEVRGLGIVRLPFLPSTAIALLVELVAPEAVVRLPAALTVVLAGVPVAALRLAPFEASSVARLRLAARSAAGNGAAVLVAPPVGVAG
jgi:serine kinase of HPr protein (carbohydrate metabolism regulator)